MIIEIDGSDLLITLYIKVYTDVIQLNYCII